MDVKHGYGLDFLSVVMQPGIDGIGFWVALEVKDFHDAFLYSRSAYTRKIQGFYGDRPTPRFT